MALTTAQLNALESAIATGQLTVSYDGKTVTYRSIDELLKAHAFVKTQLIAAGLLTPPASTNRGPSTLTVFSRD